MSETTNLKLKKHDEPLNENTEQFNVRDYLNGNWDKIEDFAGQVNDKVIEIEDSIDLVKQRTEQAVEEINTDIENIKQEQTEQNTNIQKNTTDILNLNTNKASKAELQEATIALQAELLKAQEEIERQNKDYEAGTLEGQDTGESLYLQDSSDARFREFGIGGNSKQEKREGYNKFDIQKWLDNDLNVAHGTENSKSKDKISLTATEADCFTNTYAMSQAISNNQQLINKFGTEVKPDTAYTIYLDKNNTETDTLYAFFCDADYNYISLKNKTSVNNYNILNFTTPENAKYLTFRLGIVNVDKTIEFSNIMILEGTYTKETLPKYEQYGAMPSLEFPSEVEAVGQDVNIFDKNNATTLNAYVENTANTVVSSYVERIIIIPCEPNTTYTILKNIKTSIPRFRIDCASKNPVVGDTVTKLIYNTQIDKATVTTTSDAQYLLLQMYSEPSTETVTREEVLNNIKIVKGTEINGYSPDNCGSANVTVCNKNFFDKNTVVWEAGKRINSSTGKLESGSLEWSSTQNYIPVPSNTKLHFKGTVCYGSWRFYMHTYDANKQFIKTLELNNPSETRELTFNTEEARFVRFTFNPLKIDWDSIQLEEGETATDVIAHEEQTFTIPVQQEMLEGDKFEKVNGVWKEKHSWSKKIFTGQENILSVNRRNTNTILVQANIAGCYIPNENEYGKTYAYSNCFAGSGRNIVFGDNANTVALGNSDSRILFNVPIKIVGTDEAEQLNNFKAKLVEQYEAGTPVTVYYQLAEPMYLDCTPEQIAVLDEIEKTLHSYKGGTHVYSVDEISPIFNAKYTRDQETYIKNEINKMQAMILAE